MRTELKKRLARVEDQKRGVLHPPEIIVVRSRKDRARVEQAQAAGRNPVVVEFVPAKERNDG